MIVGVLLKKEKIKALVMCLNSLGAKISAVNRQP
jgi:hypothetical protein